MSKQKQDKQGGGWQFPRPIEIIKCKEGNKEYMKERPARKPYCGHAGIDIEEAIRIKHEYNKTRPYRHGGKKC